MDYTPFIIYTLHYSVKFVDAIWTILFWLFNSIFCIYFLLSQVRKGSPVRQLDTY